MRSVLVRACLALGMSLAWASTAAAEDWILSGYANGRSYFTDLATLSRQGDVVRSWMREDLPRPARGAGGASYSHTFTERYDDCSARRFSFTASVRRNDKGEVVESFTNPGGWRDMVPGSVTESLWRVACAATTPPKEKPLVEDLGAGAWTLLGKSADNRYVMYAAFDRIVRLDAQHVLVLTRSDFVQPQWIEGLPIRHALSASIIDCANRKTAEAGLDTFLSPTIRVRSVRAASEADLKFDSPAPGSFAFASLDRFCSAPAAVSAPGSDKDPGGALSGTAWLVTKGYLVTADHVVAGAKELAIYSNGEAVGRAEIVSEDAANDLAVLKPVRWTSRRRVALPLAPHGATLGKRVFTLGYPAPDTLGQHLEMTAGEVSGTTGPHDDADDLQISAPIQPGNSGGPVLTWDGAVIGIVDSKLTTFEGDGADDPKPELVNYAVKAAYLRPMLDDLPDLGGYQVLAPKGGHDELIAEAGRSVFMVVATH